MVIDHLTHTFPESDVGITYIYFDYKKTWGVDKLLRSALADLIRSTSTSLPRPLLQLYEQHHRKKSRPKTDEISKLFASESYRFSKVFVIIDAVDECQPVATRTKLFEGLSFMGSMLRLMIVGRPTIDVLKSYPQAMRLIIQAEVEDVRKCLNEQVK